MKKWLTCFLLLMLALTVVGCSQNDPAAYEAYLQANNDLEKADGMIAEYTLDMTMVINDEEMPITMDGYIEMVRRSETDVDMKVMMSNDLTGDITAYYTDGYYYMDMAGQKFKMAMSLEEAMAQTSMSTVEFTDEMIKEQSITDTDKGQELHFVLDGPSMTDLLKTMMGNVDPTLTENMEMTINDVTVEAQLTPEGQIQSTAMDMSFDMTAEGLTIPIKMTMAIDYVQIGNVTVDLPDDLADYEEMPIEE